MIKLNINKRYITVAVAISPLKFFSDKMPDFYEYFLY